MSVYQVAQADDGQHYTEKLLQRIHYPVLECLPAGVPILQVCKWGHRFEIGVSRSETGSLGRAAIVEVRAA
jgi:hypothetical protein